MPVKIRLRRMGAKKRPFYRLVVANSTDARDGRFIETVGYYDPCTEPPTVKVDADRVQRWLKNGAQPSDTARSLLRKQGVIAGGPVSAAPAPTPAPEPPAKPATKRAAKAAAPAEPAPAPAAAVEPDATTPEAVAAQPEPEAAVAELRTDAEAQPEAEATEETPAEPATEAAAEVSGGAPAETA